MKIVYIANAGSVHFKRWYEFFIAHGHEVHLISSNPALLEYKLDIPGLPIYYLPDYKSENRKFSFMMNTLRLPFIIKRIKEIIRDINPDVLHAHQVYAEGFWGALSGFRPLIVTPIGADMDTFSYQYYIYGKISEYVLRQADLVTGDSYTVKDNCTHFGMKSNFKLIQNGVDTDKFKWGKNESVRKNYGIGASQPLVFYARGFDAIYNVDLIIQAIPIILKKIPECKFVLARYSADTDDEFKKLVHRMGLQGSVIFTGFIDHAEMPGHYQAADLYLSVPRIDNSPHSVYEAMACGVPTIIGRLPWTVYEMRHRENTYIIDDVNPESIARAVIGLYNDQPLKRTIAENAVDLVDRKFSYATNMEKMEKLMVNLIGPKQNQITGTRAGN